MFAYLHDAIVQASPNVWLLILGLGGASGYGLWRFSRALSRSRLIENTPDARMRSAAQGFVELRGHAHALPEAPIEAPLSGQRCVWFEFRVDVRRSSAGQNEAPDWDKVEQGRSRATFEVRDGEAHCLVDPDGADVIVVDDDTWYGDTPRPEPGTGRSTGWEEGRRYRYTERRLAEGQWIHVWGELSSRSVTQGQATAVSALLREWKLDRIELLRRFDANRDGEIDPDEWDAARMAARQEVSSARARAPEPAARGVVAEPTSSAMPFMISAKDEDELLAHYRREIAIHAALFLLAGSACVWMLGVRLAG